MHVWIVGEFVRICDFGKSYTLSGNFFFQIHRHSNHLSGVIKSNVVLIAIAL